MRFSALSPLLAGLLLSLVLCSCDIPDHPEGADIEGMTQIGNQLRAGGDDAGAVEFYQRATQRTPNDVAPHRALAEILEAHGNNADAAIQYQQCMRIEPSNGEFARAYGRVLIKMGQFEAAKEQYQKALQIDDRDIKALNGLGITLDNLGQHAAAEKAYKEALDYQYDDMVTLNNLAHSYVLAGGYLQAIALLEPYASDARATPVLRQNLAEAYGMAGMDADAERVARMDLSPAQVQQAVSNWRARRGKLAPVQTLTADLGSYPTAEVAAAHSEAVKAQFPQETEALVLSADPEVKAIGGTPSFVVHAVGFGSNAKLRAFCAKLKKADLACKPHKS